MASEPSKEGPSKSSNEGSLEAFEEITERVVQLNERGVQELRSGDIETALTFLTRASERLRMLETTCEAETVSRDKLQADTNSNLGMCYRRCKEHSLAIQHMLSALRFYEDNSLSARSLAASLHLNIATCFLEARQPNHAQALRHSLAAVEHAGHALEVAPIRVAKLGGDGPMMEYCAILAMGYQKVAMCHRAARHWDLAAHAYSQAREVAHETLGEQHELTKAITEECHEVPKLSGRFTPQPLSSMMPNLPVGRIPPDARVNLRKYDLRDRDVFPQWPPKNSSINELKWYDMASRRHV